MLQNQLTAESSVSILLRLNTIIQFPLWVGWAGSPLGHQTILANCGLSYIGAARLNASYIPAAHMRHVSSTLPWPLGAYFLPNFKRQKTHLLQVVCHGN